MSPWQPPHIHVDTYHYVDVEKNSPNYIYHACMIFFMYIAYKVVMDEWMTTFQ